MYALFETEFGVRMVRAEEKIRAVLPDAEQCELLANRCTSTPLLSVERIAYTYNDLPMELRRGLYLTDTPLLSKCAELTQLHHASPMSACCGAIEFWLAIAPIITNTLHQKKAHP